MTSRSAGEALSGMRLNASGSAQLVGTAAQLYVGWEVLLRAVLTPHASQLAVSPGIFDAKLIEQSGYGTNFPHQLVAIPPAGFLPPAACLSVYPGLAGARLPVSVLTVARCGRSEEQHWELPFRLRTFTMMELVLVGHAAEIADIRAECVQVVESLFERLGIPGRFAVATDAFFLGTGSGARLLQKIKELKREFVFGDTGVSPAALCSVNNHERYFVDRFGLGDPDTESTCIAFGLERITAASLLTWGCDPRDWPPELRP